MSDKKTIFVVDDDPDFVEQMRLTLNAAGYDVVTATGTEEAEEKLLSVRPDLAVFDLMMEQMDSGFVLSHSFKQLYPQTPIILLTAVAASTGINFATPSAESQAWLKVDKVLDKPVRPDQLRAEIRRLLKEPAGQTEHHHP